MAIERVFPERVWGSMTRVVGDKVYLVRRNTYIQLGDSEETLASAFLTNPGSYTFSTTEWTGFEAGRGGNDEYTSWGYPDLTMQCIIQAIREGYRRAGAGSPDGRVHIYNLSNVVTPKAKETEDYHRSVAALLGPDKLRPLLEEPCTHVKEDFVKVLQDSRFVIFGFAADVFREKAETLKKWEKEYPGKLVAAIDAKKRYSAPRRWRTEPKLMNSAAQSLFTVLTNV